jgi:hypothetical protein
MIGQINDDHRSIESRPERAGGAVPEVMVDRLLIVARAEEHLVAAVNASVSRPGETQSPANEGPVQLNREGLGETLKHAAQPQPAEEIDAQNHEISGGGGLDVAEARRLVNSSYPSEVEYGGRY